MDYKVGDIILGKVTGVKPYALFMTFDGGINGLLHISELSNSYIRDIDKYGRVGDEMKVKILTIEDKNSFLRVSFKQVPEEEKFTTHDNNKKEVIEISEDEFTPLREKLPEWIDETLAKAKEEN